jgi:PAS domain S-box-containing protein
MLDERGTEHRSPELSLWQRPARAYALAIAGVALATLLRFPFEPFLQGRAPYGLYFPVLLVITWFCGVGPTVLAALLSLLAAWYFFVPPAFSFVIDDAGDRASLLLFALTAAANTWLAHKAEAARRAAAHGAHAERREHESAERLAAIVASSDDAIIAKDLDGVIQSWNAAAERLFGYRADEMIGRPLLVLIPPERSGEEERILAQLRSGKRIDHFETVRMTKAGQRIEVSVTTSPVRDASGVIIGASKIARDITERKRAERALAQQREWFRVTLSSIGDAVITTDRSAVISFMNPVAERLTGWTAAEAVGQPLANVFQIVNEQTRAPVDNPCESVLRSGAIVGLANHTSLIARDGSQYPIEDSAAPIVDDQKSILGVVLVFHDVTERRQAEAAIAEQREWLETTLVSIGDAVIATDLHGRVVFMNPVAEQMTGWRSGEARGRDCADVFRIVNESTRAPIESPVARVLREGVVVGLANHTLLVARDGSQRSIDDSAAPIRGGDGRVAGVVLVFHDVSERRRSEQDRHAAEREREQLLQSERAARGEAERANRLKDDFVATLSHELRTPLNAILGWAEILRRQPRDAGTLERGLAVIERNTRVQAQLISDLFDVSRIVSGKLRLELQLCDVGAVVDQAIETLRPSADAKAVAIDCQLERGIEPVAGDFARLSQIVWNLLSNAIKFTGAGGRVSVRVERRGAVVAITVSDTGAGIRPDFLPYLFDRFRQADASTTRRFGGLGLGLTIVKQLAELHGGTVSAHSAGEGHGATFVVELPLDAVSSATDARFEQRRSVLALNGDGPSIARLEGLKVIVVEDEPDARELVERLLLEAGCQVTAVASAAAAITALAGDRFDVLISDIGLPDEDGYSLIERIRHLDRTAGGRVPAIALTAFARSEDRTRALRAGFQAHVAKPVEPAELLAIVASLADIVAAGSTAAADPPS